MKKWIIIVRYVTQVCHRIAACVAGIGGAKKSKSGDKIVLAAEHDSERITSYFYKPMEIPKGLINLTFEEDTMSVQCSSDVIVQAIKTYVKG